MNDGQRSSHETTKQRRSDEEIEVTHKGRAAAYAGRTQEVQERQAKNRTKRNAPARKTSSRGGTKSGITRPINQSFRKGSHIMRYDNLLQKLQKITDRYEAEVRDLLASQVKADDGVTAAILAPRKLKTKGSGKIGRPRKKLHWTQRPENKAKLRKMLKKAAVKRHPRTVEDA